MVDLKNIDLLALQSRYMQGDIITQALCAALNPLLRDLGDQARLTALYPRIDFLSGPALDELAWGLHVDGYNALADDSEKRRLIKNSCLVHKYKGTAFAVRKIVESVFGEAGSIEEWFQYGGSPYHFRMDVLCSLYGVTAAEQHRAIQLVNAGKNLRSELDGIRLILSQGATERIAAVGTWGILIDVYPVGQIDTHTVQIASAEAHTQVVTVCEKGS